ncbi:MAG: hypothetical protein MK384_02765 [SAR202 cluster bacterium]|nr:hypothetical protein [SAR202 cluster bacterium]
MPRSGKTRRVYSNDDGWIMGTPYPLTEDYIWENMIGPHQGTPIEGFMWSVGGHDTYNYETEIGERFGEGYDNLDEKQQASVDNLRYLEENHGGPVTLIAAQCRRAGIDFFPSVRMNEHYDMEIDSPSYSRLRRENPHYLIGRGEDIPGPTLEWGIRTGLNYAVPEVREYMASIIVELISRFDVDGIELDYMRHPGYFRIEEAYANRYLMTDLIRFVREQMDAVSASKGKELDLIVRVPPTIRDCTRVGLDVTTWIQEELVDVMIAGGGFIPFETPVHEFVAAAEGTGCLIYGAMEALRGTVDELTLRAVAARYLEQGVQGLYLFNFYSMSQEWRNDVLGVLTDEKKLSRLDKRYEFDKRGNVKPDSQLGFSFQYGIPSTQLATTLETTVVGPSTSLTFHIADRIEEAKAEGVLGDCTVSLLLENIGPGDSIEVSLNDSELDPDLSQTSADGWTRDFYAEGWNTYPTKIVEATDEGVVIEWVVDAPPLKGGVNHLDVRLRAVDNDRTMPLILKDVRVWIKYV